MPKERATPKDDGAKDTTKPANAGAAAPPLMWMGTAWIEAMSDLGSELASFLAARIRDDVETQQAILNCKSVTEMQAIQMAFMERAYQQYAAEAGKVIEKSTSLFPKLPGQTKHTPV